MMTGRISRCVRGHAAIISAHFHYLFIVARINHLLVSYGGRVMKRAKGHKENKEKMSFFYNLAKCQRLVGWKRDKASCVFTCLHSDCLFIYFFSVNQPTHITTPISRRHLHPRRLADNFCVQKVIPRGGRGNRFWTEMLKQKKEK